MKKSLLLFAINEKNEPMILKSYSAFNRGAKDYIKDDKTGKEYTSYLFPEFVFDDTKIKQQLSKSEIKPSYVFVIRFSDHVDEVKLIAKQKEKVLRERIKVNIDIN